jgi:hypothetical protein
VSARPHFLRPGLLEERNGGSHIDTTAHGRSAIHQPPLSDEHHEHRLREAEQRERDEAITRRNWAICDAAVSVILVLTVALLIGGAR